MRTLKEVEKLVQFQICRINHGGESETQVSEEEF